MRRVVVTGLSAITPLGASLAHTWRALIAAKSGLVKTPDTEEYNVLPNKAAGLVPTAPAAALAVDNSQRRSALGSDGGRGALWTPDAWLSVGDQRRMAKYTQYAIAAAEMALLDADWNPEPGSIGARDTGVCLGSGIGNFEEVYDTSVLYHNGVRLVFLLSLQQHADTHFRAIRRSPPSSCPSSSSTSPPATSP